jgi:hypothetical protein
MKNPPFDGLRYNSYVCYRTQPGVGRIQSVSALRCLCPLTNPPTILRAISLAGRKLKASACSASKPSAQIRRICSRAWKIRIACSAPAFQDKEQHGISPLPELTTAHATLGNKSLKPTRIEVGRRRVRFVGLAALVTWTETPFPSGTGSETISNCWPYMRMRWEEP